MSLYVFQDYVTLTLAGLAGFILSIGMAVDANILIFERAKEEMSEGGYKEEASRMERSDSKSFPQINHCKHL